MIKNHWSKNGGAQMDKMQKTFKMYWKWMILVEDDGFPGPQKVPYHPCAKWGMRAFGPQNEPKMRPNAKKPCENVAKMNVPK